MGVSLKTEKRRTQETPMTSAIHFKKLKGYEPTKKLNRS
jgi:hypothetical protein